ncbi:hypothetical protein CMV_009981, partial [Castanea mollissima]
MQIPLFKPAIAQYKSFTDDTIITAILQNLLAFMDTISPSSSSSSTHQWKYHVFLSFRDISNLSGWSLKDRLESEFIKDIITEISLKLSSLFP